MFNTQKRVCIIKLDGMGDILRTTAILRHFCNDDVTWITEKASLVLLQHNQFIRKAIAISDILDFGDFMFEELYNFDEDKKACLLATNIRAEKKKGYDFKEGNYFPFDSDSKYAYELSKNDELKFKLNKKTYQ